MSQADRIALTAYYRACGLRYEDIARVLRVDVSTVSRDVRNAETRGWLRRRFELTDQAEVAARVRDSLRETQLEGQLAEALRRVRPGAGAGLAADGIVVVQAGDDDGTGADDDARSLQMLGVEGCRLLVDRLVAMQALQPQRELVLGVAWGRSTGAVVSTLRSAEELPELPRLRTVPLQGGVGGTTDADEGRLYPDILCHEVATAFKSSLRPVSLSFPAFIGPGLVDELGPEGIAAIWRFVRADRSFAAASAAYAALDLGLIGVGALEDDGWAKRSGFVPKPGMAERLKQQGALGDIVCRFFGAAGDAPAFQLQNQRAIGITLAQLQQRVAAGACVIAVAGGRGGAKAGALNAAVLNGLVSDVVTDALTARRMLHGLRS